MGEGRMEIGSISYPKIHYMRGQVCLNLQVSHESGSCHVSKISAR